MPETEDAPMTDEEIEGLADTLFDQVNEALMPPMSIPDAMRCIESLQGRLAGMLDALKVDLNS